MLYTRPYYCTIMMPLGARRMAAQTRGRGGVLNIIMIIIITTIASTTYYYIVTLLLLFITCISTYY